MASAGVLAGGVGTAVPDPLEAVAESEWALASEPGMDETFAEEARGVVVAAAAEACADRVVAAVAARVPSAESLEKSRFEPDAPERGRGYPKPPAALVSALRALVGCVSATGASGAEAAHGALYRAADAVWALSCLDAYEAKAAAHAKRVTEVSESELGRGPAAALASAAAPSNAFGWDPHVVLAFCARAACPSRRPRPELADAVASLAPPGASDALHDPRDAARQSRRGGEARRRPFESPGWGLSGVALCGGTRPLAFRRRRRGCRAPRGRGRRAAAASAAVAACPSRRVGDALASVAGRAARDSLASRRGDPAERLREKWWAANHAEAVLDPLDEHVSPDGVPGDARAAAPARPRARVGARRQGGQVSLDDSRRPLGPRRGPGSRRRRSWRRRTRARASRRASGRRRRRRSRPASGPR